MRGEVRRDIAIGLMATILLLFLGEIAVRTYARSTQHRPLRPEWQVPDPALGLRLKPGFKQGGIEINSLGFRGQEFPVQKGAGTFRIVAMGDSTTFGYGETSASPYPVQLQIALDQRTAACGQRYEVINAGVEGYAARNVLARLEKEVLTLAPDLLIVYVGWNDLFGLDPEDRLPTVNPNSWFNRFLRRSYLLQAATKVVFRTILPLREEVTPERIARYQSFMPTPFLEDYRRIVRTARARGVAIAVTTLPSVLGAESWEENRGILHYPAFTARPELLRILWERYNQAIRGLAAEMNVPLLGLAEGIRRIQDGRTLFIDTLHFNTPGYRAVAEVMLGELAAARLLPCPAAGRPDPLPGRLRVQAPLHRPGARDFTKEEMGISGDGEVPAVDDSTSPGMSSGKGPGMRTRVAGKGHQAELEAFHRLVTGEAEPPMTLEEMVEATELSFAVRDQVR